MSACDPIRKRLSAYLDDEVPLPERRAIEDHLATCPRCRTLREELARATQVLAGTPEPHWNPGSTDALVAKLRTQIARERPAAPPAHVIPPAAYSWRALALPLAAVFLVVAVPGLWMGVRSPERSKQDVVAQASVAPAPRPAEQSAARAPEPVVAKAGELQGERRREPGNEPATARAGALANVAPAKPRAGLVGAKPAETLASATAPASTLASATAPGAVRGDFPAGTLANAAAPGGPAQPPAGAGALATVTTRAGADASPVPAGAGALSGLDIEIAELERRMAAVEREVSAFTTAAREQARRESSQVASRRFATWR